MSSVEKTTTPVAPVPKSYDSDEKVQHAVYPASAGSDAHDVTTHEVTHEAHKGPKKNIFQRFWFWCTDRDYHVWIMSLGFTLLFISYPIQGVQTIREFVVVLWMCGGWHGMWQECGG